MPWAVLSAEYGVWRPDIEMRPYDATMNHKLPAEFAKWHASVASKVLDDLWEPMEDGRAAGPIRPGLLSVEIHAGANYAHPLAELLRSLGVIVSLPCEGLGIGQQLALYTSGALSEVVT